MVVRKIRHLGESLVEGVHLRILGVARGLDLVAALVEEILRKVLAGDVPGGVGADDLLVLASVAVVRQLRRDLPCNGCGLSLAGQGRLGRVLEVALHVIVI